MAGHGEVFEMIDTALSIREVAALVGASPATIRNWVRAGHFPSGVRVGPCRVVWPPDAIDKWWAERRAEGKSNDG